MLQIQSTTQAKIHCGDVGPPDVIVEAAAKRYSGAVLPIFENLSMVCPAGKITVIVGPSGCGKTTLLRCLCGLEPIATGSIWFDGVDVTRIDAQHRGVAMVFQNYALYPSKTVAENIAFPLRMAGMAKPERDIRVKAAAELVKLDELLDRLPAQLSGGQKQRVGIARAIVRRPRVLLMDEPLSNLDTKLRAEMRIELAALQRKIGATTIYVTHDQTEALSLADHLIVMRGGVIEQQGSPGDLFRKPVSTFVADFLGAMNLVHAKNASGALGSRPNPAVSFLQRQLMPSDQPLILGFRPEDVRTVAPTTSYISFKAEVLRTEFLGSDSLIHLSLSGEPVRARLPITPQAGDVLTLFIEEANIHHFSADGRRNNLRTKNEP